MKLTSKKLNALRDRNVIHVDGNFTLSTDVEGNLLVSFPIENRVYTMILNSSEVDEFVESIASTKDSREWVATAAVQA